MKWKKFCPIDPKTYPQPGNYLIYTLKGYIDIDKFISTNSVARWWLYNESVTHYMSLPKPPKPEE